MLRNTTQHNTTQHNTTQHNTSASEFSNSEYRIPPVAHIIWFGPNPLEKIKTIAKQWHLSELQTSELKINLWITPPKTKSNSSKKEYWKNVNTCLQNEGLQAHLKIRNIGEVSSHFCDEFMQEIEKGNGWSISDILRFVILAKEPGWYIDADTSLIELTKFDGTCRYGFLTDISNAEAGISPVQVTMKIIGVACQNHPIIQAILNTMQSTLQHVVQDSWIKERIDSIYGTKSKKNADYWFAFYITGFVMSYVLAEVQKGYTLKSFDLPESLKKGIKVYESNHEEGSIPMMWQLDLHVHMRHAAMHAWIRSGAAHSASNIDRWINTMGLSVRFDHGKSLTIIDSLKTIEFLKERNYLGEWDSGALLRKFVDFWIKALVEESADDIKCRAKEVIAAFKDNPKLINLISSKLENHLENHNDCDADKKQVLSELLKEISLQSNEHSRVTVNGNRFFLGENVSEKISVFFKELTVSDPDSTDSDQTNFSVFCAK
jgi:hypothetical protein